MSAYSQRPNDMNRSTVKIQKWFRAKTMKSIPSMKSIPTLTRQSSFNISNQGANFNCWNHTASKILCRLMFNVLDEPNDAYDKISPCNEFYNSRIHNILDIANIERILDQAKRKCGAEYKKYMLYLFFFHIMNKKFGCMVSRTKDALVFMTKTLFSRRNTFLTFIKNEYEDTSDASSKIINEKIITYIMPMFDRFYDITTRLSDVPIFSEYSVYHEDLTDFADLSIIPYLLINTLDNGLYLGVSLPIGDSTSSFYKEFMKYRKTDEKPIPPENHEPKNYHIMTIVGYSVVDVVKPDTKQKQKRIVLHIKNSWGTIWGNNGMIDYFIEDLYLFKEPSIIFVEPDEVKCLAYRKLSNKNVDEYIDELNQQVSNLITISNPYPILSLLKRGANIYTYNDTESMNSLHLACMHDVKDLAKYLLNRGMYIEIFDELKRTPLMIAMEYKQWDMVYFMLLHGANIDKIDKNVLFEEAHKEDHKPLISYLLKNVFILDKLNGSGIRTFFKYNDVNALDKEGLTLLFRYTRDNNVRMILNLLQNGADPNKPTRGNNRPLLIACTNNHFGIVELLLKSGADPRLEGKNGATPLKIAERKKNTEMIKLLSKKIKELDIEDEKSDKMSDKMAETLSEKTLQEKTPHEKRGGSRMKNKTMKKYYLR